MLEDETSWSVAKGVPATGENIVSAVYACYNCVVSHLVEDRRDASVHWYNKEIFTCCKKAMAVMNHEDFTLPKNCQVIPNDDLLSTYAQCVAHRELTCELSHALEVLGIALVVIWSMKVTDQNERRNICTRLLGGLQATPFDCMMEANGVCKHSLMTSPYHVLEAVFLTKSRGAILANHKHMLVYLMYIQAFFKYQGKKYQECMKLLTDHGGVSTMPTCPSENVAMANIYNLIACCYAQTGQMRTALVYYRKALQSSQGHVTCYLYNAVMAYDSIAQTGTSATMSDLLPTSLDANPITRIEEKLLSVGPKQDVQVVSLSDISGWGNIKEGLDLPKALYASGSHNLKAGRYGNAAKQYDRLLKCILSPTALLKTGSVLPLPAEEQIRAERQLAMCMGGAVAPDLEDACKAMLDIRIQLQKRVHRLDSCYEQLSIQTCQEFFCSADKLVSYISYMLCYIRGALQNTGTKCLLTALGLLNSWVPKKYILNCPEADKSVLASVEVAVNYLNNIQAKILLNKAILMTATKCEKEDIFKVLQAVFQFSSHDIEIRWSVTLMLWKLGQRVEACKMWMRTRGMNKDLSNEKILALVKGKSAGRHSRRDTAVLKEVLSSRQMACVSLQA